LYAWLIYRTMDSCLNPTNTHLVGFLSGHGKGPGPSEELYPVFAMCKTTLHSDVLAVSLIVVGGSLHKSGGGTRQTRKRLA
jgi:hypothetical protein